MYSNVGLALFAAAVSVVHAQTWTDCNPLKTTTCPPNPAIGKAGVYCDFAADGACDAFHVMDGTPFRYELGRGALAEMTAPRQAPTLRSNRYIFFGRVDVTMQAAAGAGIVSSAVLQSDDLDEIDFEMVGADNARVQSNYFSKGNDTVFDRGESHDVDDPLGALHVYSFDWTRDRILWLIDNVVVRTLERKAVPGFPEAPAQIKLGAWVAGFEGQRPGTTEWAGGIADFSDGPRTAVYQSIRIVDYAGGSGPTDRDVKEYVYTDFSGSVDSIRVVPDGPEEQEEKKQRISTPSSDENETSTSTSTSTPDPTTTTADSETTAETTPATSSDDTTTTSVTSSPTKTVQLTKTSGKASEVPSSGASTTGVAVGAVALLVAGLVHLSGL